MSAVHFKREMIIQLKPISELGSDRDWTFVVMEYDKAFLWTK